MARQTLAVQQISLAGIEPTLDTGHADGHAFSNDGRTFIRVVNGATAVDVTVPTTQTVQGFAVADHTVTVPENESRDIGPFPVGLFNQSDNTVHVDFDDESNVTIAALRL